MKKVLLGMSGGVDSSVSAILLKEAGYEVIGATMNLYKQTKFCTISSAVEDAKKVCDVLQIPHYVFEATTEFENYVVQDFIKCYECGKTPNPCIECNKHIKFDWFYQKAKELGCDYIATGHYAKVMYDEKFGQVVLRKSKAEKKDQTYFLYGISKEILEHILFPLEEYTDKEQIREIAQEHGLAIAQKPDSQEVCFIPDNDYASFVLKNGRNKAKKGKMVTRKGEIVGEHKGLIYYTIGQRKGLGISYKEPLYVLKLEVEKNQVIVGTQQELYQKELYANELNFLMFDTLKESIEVTAKIRYRAKEAEATIYPISADKVKVKFKEPQKSITPGQSVVFYQGDIVIGGGKII